MNLKSLEITGLIAISFVSLAAGYLEELFSDYPFEKAGILLIALIGYVVFRRHELKWLVIVWILVYGSMLLLIIVNKSISVILHRFYTVATPPELVLTPFPYLLACFMPKVLKRRYT